MNLDYIKEEVEKLDKFHQVAFLKILKSDPNRLKSWLKENDVSPELIGKNLLYSYLRQVLEDYIHNPRTVKIIGRLIVVFVIITIIWSAIAIFSFNPEAIMAIAN